MASVATKPSLKMSNHHIIQASTKQDFATSGEDYLVVADTHGPNKILLDILQDYDWKLKLNHENWTLEIMNKMRTYSKNGSTLTVFKIYPDRFECFWIGDSSGKIYSGTEVVFETKDHDYNHVEDLKKVNWFPRTDIKVQDARTILQVESKAIDIRGERTNMTRCLGHKGFFHGNGFEKATIPRENAQYKIVAGSDGFWQMMCEDDTPFIANPENNSKELAEFANRRWHQKWIFQAQGTTQKGVQFPKNNIDDICVASYGEHANQHSDKKTKSCQNTKQTQKTN